MKEASTAETRRPLVRRGFLISLLGLFCFIGVVLWRINSTAQGGHIGTSPDGRYSLSVWGPLEPGLGDTCTVELTQPETGYRIQTLAVTVADDEWGPTIRGQTEIIWADDGTSVTVLISSVPWLTLYLPEDERLDNG